MYASLIIGITFLIALGVALWVRAVDRRQARRVLERRRERDRDRAWANNLVRMSDPLTELLASYGIQLQQVSSLDPIRGLGTYGSSVCAQACVGRIVEAIEISLPAAYGILHEAAHILEGFEDEIQVMYRQKALADLLPEPWKHRGYEFHTSYVSTGL